MIATLGLLIIVHGIIIGWRDVTRGAQSFFGVPRETGVWTAAIGCILALVVEQPPESGPPTGMDCPANWRISDGWQTREGRRYRIEGAAS